MIALVFPGQGSQYLGMGKEFYEYSEKARRIFALSEEITGIPVRKLSFEGPLEELTLTENLQVAITTVNLASFEVLKETVGEGFQNLVSFTAGHSLGEFSALYASGVLSLEDTLLVVKKRGELMGKASTEKPSGMYAIINLDRSILEELLTQAEGLVIISNYNSPRQLVISGEEPALSQVAERAKSLGAKAVKLRVSAGFHSPLMAEAEREFAKFLEGVEFRDPVIPFVSSVSAQAEREGAKIKELIMRQITSPVRWIEAVEFIYSQGVRDFVEVGPKQVLKGLISQTLEGQLYRCYNLETLSDLEVLKSEIFSLQKTSLQ